MNCLNSSTQSDIFTKICIINKFVKPKITKGKPKHSSSLIFFILFDIGLKNFDEKNQIS